jgi:hypothetical protein
MFFSVYCRKPLDAFTDAALEQALRMADSTAAEGYGLDEAAAKAAWEHLHVADHCVWWRARELRPVQFNFWSDVDEVRIRQEEALEKIEHLPPLPRQAITTRLSGVTAIAGIEVGFFQVCKPDMGYVIAYELAYFLAREADGMIEATDNTWWVWIDSRWKQIG